LPTGFLGTAAIRRDFFRRSHALIFALSVTSRASIDLQVTEGKPNEVEEFCDPSCKEDFSDKEAYPTQHGQIIEPWGLQS
jgi:hypothetical protein